MKYIKNIITHTHTLPLFWDKKKIIITPKESGYKENQQVFVKHIPEFNF